MSKLADDTYKVLEKLFPFNGVEKEYYVYYKNTRLFFDFYLPQLGVFIECDGEQHTKFVKHFHGTIECFYTQKSRDALKNEWVSLNDLTLVRLYDKIDKINEDLILQRIYEALDE